MLNTYATAVVCLHDCSHLTHTLDNLAKILIWILMMLSVCHTLSSVVLLSVMHFANLGHLNECRVNIIIQSLIILGPPGKWGRDLDSLCGSIARDTQGNNARCYTPFINWLWIKWLSILNAFVSSPPVCQIYIQDRPCCLIDLLIHQVRLVSALLWQLQLIQHLPFLTNSSSSLSDYIFCPSPCSACCPGAGLYSQAWWGHQSQCRSHQMRGYLQTWWKVRF